MKIRCIEHVDDFNTDEHVFWLEVDDVPEEFIREAKEIDGDEFLETCFGICVVNSESEWFVCEDNVDCELFYINNDGDKCWLAYKLTEDETNEAIEFCKNNL